MSNSSNRNEPAPCCCFLEDALKALRQSFQVVGNAPEAFFTNLRSVAKADTDSLVFVSAGRKDAAALIAGTLARIVICEAAALPPELPPGKVFVVVDNPKLAYLRIGNTLFRKNQSWGIHPKAEISEKAEIHPKSWIGPYTVVGACRIGEGSVIHGGCYLYDGVRIGKNVILHAGCVIGAEAFGHIRNEDGVYENFPHLAGVVIEDNVEIAPNACVARGALEDTVIRRGAKVDCLVQVGHNAVVGESAMIISNSVLGGSSRIGDNAFVGMGVSIVDHISVGKGAYVGAGSVIAQDVPDGASIVPRTAVQLPRDLWKSKKQE